MKTVCYLRKGRKLRASGEVIWKSGGMVKVKPARKDWSAVLVTMEEIEAGKEKPPYHPREKRHDENILGRKKPRKNIPKPAPLPHWKWCVDRVRTYEADHEPHGWPAVTMQFLSEMADELEGAHAKLSEFLPLNP